MGMSMGTDFANPMNLGVAMEMTLKKGISTGYNFTHPTPISFDHFNSLLKFAYNLKKLSKPQPRQDIFN